MPIWMDLAIKIVELIAGTPRKYLEQILTEGYSLLNNIDSFWEILGEQANRYFESSDQAYNWLSQILSWLEEGIKNKGI